MDFSIGTPPKPSVSRKALSKGSGPISMRTEKLSFLQATGTDLPSDVISSLGALTVPDDATGAVEAVVGALNLIGFQCEREYGVADRGDGWIGRIDVLACREELVLALEIDRKSARDKSVIKLRQVDAVRGILLRGAASLSGPLPEGIHFMLSLKITANPRGVG